MGGFRGVCGLVLGMVVCVWGGLYAVEPTIPLYLYNGNVGVGTETPTAMLDVSGNFKVRGPVAFRGFLDVGYDTDGLGKLSFHHSHTTPGNRYYTGWVYRNSQGGLALESSDANNLNIQFGGSVNYGTLSFQSVSWNAETSQKTATTRMVIKGDSGNVGIGTTSPEGVFMTAGTGDQEIRFTHSDNVPGRKVTLRLTNTNSGYYNYGPYIQAIEGGGLNEYSMGIGVQNSERIRITSAGNVGIGTTAPGKKLHVVGTSSFSGNMTLMGIGTLFDNSGFLELQADSGALSGLSLATTTATPVVFKTQGMERMRIDGAGKVGIGTTLPLTKLHVAGTDGLTIAAGGSTARLSGTTNTLKFTFTTADGLTISPDKAQLVLVSNYTSSTAAFRIGASHTSGYPSYSFIDDPNTGITGGTAADTLGFVTGGTEHMRVTASGNVGIGLASPTTKLQVIGTVNATAFVGDGSGLTNVSGGWSSAGTGVFYTDRKVGIGTTGPINKLGITPASVNANERVINIYSGTTAANGYVSIGSQYSVGNTNVNTEIRFGNITAFGAPGYLAFATGTSSTTEHMRIDNAGNVGLGTATPTARLEVVGSALVNGGSLVNKNPNGPYYGPTIETDYPGSWAREYGFVRTGKTGKLFSLGVVGSGDTFNYGYIGGMSTSGTSHVSPWMVFTPSGNVGINVSAPAAKLHVNGTLRATDTLTYPRTYFQYDSRQRKPSDQSPGTFSIGFGSFYNNNTNTYADTLTFNTWPDSTGGRVNMLMLNKSTIGMRIYSGAFGSADVFSDYRDVVLANPSGNVGLGTVSPEARLHVAGNIVMGEGLASGAGIRIENRITSVNASTMGLIAWGESGLGAAGDLIFAPRTSSSLFSVRMYTNGPDGIRERVRVAPNGSLGIGTPTPTQPLHVSGNALISSRMAINAAIDNAYVLNVGGAIRATEMVVNLNGWADYVFEPDYTLMPLAELESFVKEKRHLPGVPSEAELTASGLNMAKMQTLQMQKIEELTLYVIALEKQNKALEARMEALEKRVSR